MPSLSLFRTPTLATFALVGALLLPLTAAGSPRAGKKAQRVLYLGDSMSMGEFGRCFDEQLRESGYEVYTYVAGGATPYYWLSRFKPIASDIGYWERTPTRNSRRRTVQAVPKIEPLLERHQPNIVVVQTGTNLYAQLRSKRRTKEENITEVERLCRDMAETIASGGRRVFWITPPKSHPERYPEELQTEMAEIMHRAVAPFGSVFESRDVTTFVDPYPETDGIHYGPTEARLWALQVASGFQRFAGATPEVPAALPVASSPAAAAGDVELVSTNPAPPEPAPMVRAALPVDPAGVDWGEIDVSLRLRAKTELPHASEITYQSCCILYEYEVLEVSAGYYPYDTLRVAHLGVFQRKPTAKASYEVGTERSWRMVPIETYSYFQRLQMADDLEPDLDKPVYVIKQD